MIQALDSVVLKENIKQYGLHRGDIGAVVHVYPDGTAFEVEFVTGSGETIAVLTLKPDQLRPMEAREILHARPIQAVAAAS